MPCAYVRTYVSIKYNSIITCMYIYINRRNRQERMMNICTYLKMYRDPLVRTYA